MYIGKNLVIRGRKKENNPREKLRFHGRCFRFHRIDMIGVMLYDYKGIG